MNTYPGIYKTKDGDAYLHLNEFNYYSFITRVWERDIETEGHESDTNITREYLANTYGKVESKEHADFIIELAGKYGFDITAKFTGSCKYFYISDRVLSFYVHKDSHPIATRKEIIIPLPPKEPEPKEWPQVGDEVSFPSGKGILVVDKPDINGVIIVKSTDADSIDEYKKVSFSALKKPLTPEEKLAKELEKMVYDGMDNSYDLNHNCYYLVSGLMKKYDIKKKPE